MSVIGNQITLAKHDMLILVSQVRGKYIVLKSFYGFDWILTDMNIDPAAR